MNIDTENENTFNIDFKLKYTSFIHQVTTYPNNETKRSNNHTMQLGKSMK